VELRGNLKDFSLPDIIQLVGFGRKTGVLRVVCAGGGAALFFEEGNVIHAEFPGAEGEKAVFSLFRVPHGEFRFQTNVPSPARTIAMDPTNLVMEAARLLDESRREEAEGEPEWKQGIAPEGADWFGFEEPPPRNPQDVKNEIRELLKERFGRGAKRLLQAVDQCGDTPEDLLELADRVEKYVHVFIDTGASGPIGREIRELLSGPSSG
jgi:hypothetical protein